MSKVYIGTSGFNYKHWSNGVFYPKRLSQAEWLSYYGKKFNTVELNVSFYRLPKLSTFEKWGGETPKDFCFSIKGSRYITHIKRLKDTRDSLEFLNGRIEGLGKKAGAVLWQLPPTFKKDEERLFGFCSEISKSSLKEFRHAFEFRHKSWFCNPTYEILGKNNFAVVIADSKKWPSEEVLTADFVYLRFHGGVLFSSDYTNKELKAWADKVKKWMKVKKEIYAYFNNDAMGFAPKNAEAFRKFLLA